MPASTLAHTMPVHQSWTATFASAGTGRCVAPACARSVLSGASGVAPTARLSAMAAGAEIRVQKVGWDTSLLQLLVRPRLALRAVIATTRTQAYASNVRLGIMPLLRVPRALLSASHAVRVTTQALARPSAAHAMRASLLRRQRRRSATPAHRVSVPQRDQHLHHAQIAKQGVGATLRAQLRAPFAQSADLPMQ